ncbi:cilia-and flagella-associated protein 96 isoform X2 [Meriones unguiculatus]|uniref:cilia-and flagella-associated protein 96 isoform X2 n=1 Tax=Meriones unguiculatus TaxID=10047 RepID=UPI000B4F151C|nr:cilia-and flagella-associated protein 96 isoform X2 [Meriones unguiculatus]
MPAEAGKTDMERIGLFSEMEYVTVGDRYVSLFNRPFNEAAGKNRQMLPGGSKEMSGLQAGYFDTQFTRIFEGEGYTNPNQLRRQLMMAESKKNLSKAFIPSNGDKKPSGLGSYYGTIGGPVPFFSAQLKPKDRYQSPGKNLYTNPGKKGTGYGYANVTIGKQLAHSEDLYDAAKLNIKAGGMKAGTFEPYPAHSADPYTVKLGVVVPGKGERIFHPPNGPKSRPMESIMARNVKRALNMKNYKTASADILKHLVF